MNSTDPSVARLTTAVRELAEERRASGARFFELAPSADEGSYFTARGDFTHGRAPLEPLSYADGRELADALAAMWSADGLPELERLAPRIADTADALRAAAEQDANVSQFIYAMF